MAHGAGEDRDSLLYQAPQNETGILRAAVIGTGAFGRHHASKYSKLPGVALTAIADPSADARKASMAAHGVTTVADWHDLLGKVDLVSVCSPAVTHAPIVRGFLEAGAHLVRAGGGDGRLGQLEIARLGHALGTLFQADFPVFLIAHVGLLNHQFWGLRMGGP